MDDARAAELSERALRKLLAGQDKLEDAADLLRYLGTPEALAASQAVREAIDDSTAANAFIGRELAA